VLAVHAGELHRAVAAEHASTRTTVGQWAARVARAGIQGRADAPRSGRPRLYDDDCIRDLLTLATSERPGLQPLWTHRALRDALWDANWGVTSSWVGVTSKALELRVHEVRGWIHRRSDPDFDTGVAAVQ
jgi:transposase